MYIDGLMIGRALHVLGVVLWIGGVAMETTVLLPAMRRTNDPKERVAWFKKVERAFAWQARVTTLLVGLTGLYMVFEMDAWSRFGRVDQWWLHAMVFVWIVFSVVLFILEPLVLHRWFDRRAAKDPDGTFSLIQRLHWILLAVSLATVAAAVAGAHGGVLFG